MIIASINNYVNSIVRAQGLSEVLAIGPAALPINKNILNLINV